MPNQGFVSVVIPAHNAAETLDETLRSVRSQTNQELEIIVVDDGSTDCTAAIAERHAVVDGRVRVIRQDNAGVAAARNAGWRSAASDLIAFVDADDLWAPTKIERQVAALGLGGDRVGLVYCWVAFVNPAGYVIAPCRSGHHTGNVIPLIFVNNMVVSGSTPLIRRQALIDAGGYDSGLRAAGAEGCEDHLTCCRVAAKYHFACVPEYLVGYRISGSSMSSSRQRMLRSWLIVRDEMAARYPEHRNALALGLRRYGRGLFINALRHGQVRQVRDLLFLLLKDDPVLATRVASTGLLSTLRVVARDTMRRARRNGLKEWPRGERFIIGEPNHVAGARCSRGGS